jgi:ankyrin repeat protein
VGNGNSNAASLLIQAGRDVNARAEDGWTSRMGAASHRMAEIVRALLRAGGDPNAETTEGPTALMRSAEAGDSEIVRLLLDAGANPDAKDQTGASALLYAAAGGETESGGDPACVSTPAGRRRPKRAGQGRR